MTSSQVSGTTSNSSGSLTLSSNAAAGRVAVQFWGDAIVARDTFVSVPGSEAIAPVIPTGFDLNAFDEMARQPATKRWLAAPPLVIERRVLAFEDLGKATWTGTTTVLPDAEINELEQDLIAALPELTGGVLTGFAGVTRRTTPEGETVPVAISNQITVFRVRGLLAGAGFEGFARWEFRQWVMTGGVILLDADADRGPNRRWLRFHELGHTLGFTHVTTRPSLMAPSAQPITGYDRIAGRILYSRPPGNRSPDRDPDDSSLNTLAPRRWSAWMGSKHGPERSDRTPSR